MTQFVERSRVLDSEGEVLRQADDQNLQQLLSKMKLVQVYAKQKYSHQNLDASLGKTVV